MNEASLEDLVALAVDGDATALDSVVRAIKDDIYGLAIRMLWLPADAEDATQEVLIRVITVLGSFEGRAGFRSWVYRVAVRGLLNFRRGRVEGGSVTFEEFGEDLLVGLSPAPAQMHDAERAVLRREVKIACTQAMLVCLDRDHRMAYLLGEIFALDGKEAAECLEVSAATYRKRLSRARQRVTRFTESSCGLVSRDAKCSCEGRITPALEAGRIDPQTLLFANHPVAEVNKAEIDAVVSTITRVCAGAALVRSNPAYQAPESLLQRVTSLAGGNRENSDT